MLEHEITPHPEQQRNLAEQREQFRAENQKRIHAQLWRHPSGWMCMGDPNAMRMVKDETGKWVNRPAKEWAKGMMKHLDDPVTQDFGLGKVPASLGAKLEDLAQKALLHESVTWEDGTEGVIDHDAAPCDLASMTEGQLADYVANAIEESKHD